MAFWAPPWDTYALVVRLERCRATLSAHGMLTDAEAAHVRARIDRLTRVTKAVPLPPLKRRTRARGPRAARSRAI